MLNCEGFDHPWLHITLCNSHDGVRIKQVSQTNYQDREIKLNTVMDVIHFVCT